MTLKFSNLNKPAHGGTGYTINVDRGLKPFGQIWYFKGHTATVHANTLAGAHQVFEGGNLQCRIDRAKAWMSEQNR